MTDDALQHELMRLRAAIAMLWIHVDTSAMSVHEEDRLKELLMPPDMRDAVCAATPATTKV